MEGIRGKHSYVIDRAALLELVSGRAGVLIDLGTGDGRFVAHVARTRPDWLAIGIDACRENLREQSRRAPPNALYLIANALALPPELTGVATCVTINFPWGSLLGGLLSADTGLLRELRRLVSEQMKLHIRLNVDALREQGWNLESGGEQIVRNLCNAGFVPESATAMDAVQLRAVPCTWGRRLARGRDPRGLYLALSACELRRSGNSHACCCKPVIPCQVAASEPTGHGRGGPDITTLGSETGIAVTLQRRPSPPGVGDDAR